MKWKDKPLGKMITHVQSKFVNPYIRVRDQDCYGVSISDNGQISDAGHYFPVGSYNGMRFRVDNIHGQSRSGNSFKGGDLHNYRKGLINRHGIYYVEKLELAAQKYKQIGYKFDRISVILTAETYKYILKNKIWIFDHEEFLCKRDELLKFGLIRL